MTVFEPLICDTYPRISRSDVKLLWHSGFWDGPLSGMLVFNGERCWFGLVVENEDDDYTWYRRFAVLRLTLYEIAEEQHWHDLFRLHVGTHTDYGPDERRTGGAVLPKEQHHNFYDQYQQRPKQDYSRNPILGWFET